MGKRKHRPVFTPLTSQNKEGSKLRGPLAALTPKFEIMDWLTDLLPEHLWLAALADKFGLARMPDVYNEFMDAIDPRWPHKNVALGMVSDFGLVPEAERSLFLKKNRDMVDSCFHGPLGRAMSLYPPQLVSQFAKSQRMAGISGNMNALLVTGSS